MVKTLKKIEAVKEPLNKSDVSKIYSLFKTYETGTIEFHTGFYGFHSQNDFIETLEEMEVLLTSDSVEDLKQLEKEFEFKIKEKLGDKVKILSTNKNN